MCACVRVNTRTKGRVIQEIIAPPFSPLINLIDTCSSWSVLSSSCSLQLGEFGATRSANIMTGDHWGYGKEDGKFFYSLLIF